MFFPMKLIAFGILALLALSSVMNARAFRVLVGGLAVAVLASLAGLGVLGERAAELGWIPRGLLTGYSNRQETSNSASQKIMKLIPKSEFSSDDLVEEPEESTAITNGLGAKSQVQPRLLIRVSQQSEVQQIEKSLNAIIEEYLERYQLERPRDPGIDKLTAQNVDKNLLKFKFLRKDGKYLVDQNKRFKVGLAFDDRFHEHVRELGLQVARPQRLKQAIRWSAYTGVVLFFVFAALKSVNGRKRQQPERDYLRLSEISMM